ncbi:MAG: hypothetical protein IKM72_11475, partial [Oscillospiraceae bacterium]|nr:hypothetical protein [Oscillospiraceae bacterium]
MTFIYELSYNLRRTWGEFLIILVFIALAEAGAFLWMQKGRQISYADVCYDPFIFLKRIIVATV